MREPIDSQLMLNTTADWKGSGMTWSQNSLV